MSLSPLVSRSVGITLERNRARPSPFVVPPTGSFQGYENASREREKQTEKEREREREKGRWEIRCREISRRFDWKIFIGLPACLPAGCLAQAPSNKTILSEHLRQLSIGQFR